jgi:hypothetical protein
MIMAENKDKQGPNASQTEGKTGSDGSKGNMNDKQPHNDLGNIEESQQRQSSQEGHAHKRGQSEAQPTAGPGKGSEGKDTEEDRTSKGRDMEEGNDQGILKKDNAETGVDTGSATGGTGQTEGIP